MKLDVKILDPRLFAQMPAYATPGSAGLLSPVIPDQARLTYDSRPPGRAAPRPAAAHLAAAMCLLQETLAMLLSMRPLAFSVLLPCLPA